MVYVAELCDLTEVKNSWRSCNCSPEKLSILQNLNLASGVNRAHKRITQLAAVSTDPASNDITFICDVHCALPHQNKIKVNSIKNIKMGTTTSKEVDSTGPVNNNIILDTTSTINMHSFEMVIMLAIICAIKILEVVLFIYFKHRRGLKKSFERRDMA